MRRSRPLLTLMAESSAASSEPFYPAIDPLQSVENESCPEVRFDRVNGYSARRSSSFTICP